MLNKLSDLKPADYNPRTITDQALKGLKYSIEEFGDLSGIVFNKRTGNLVAGHQRVKAIQEKYGDCTIVDNEITVQGDHLFNIRIVDWDITKEKAANVAANNPNLQGEYTSDLKLVISDLKFENYVHLNELRLDEIRIPKPQVSLEDPPSNFSYQEQYGVIVICENESHQEEMYNKFLGEGLNVRVVTT